MHYEKLKPNIPHGIYKAIKVRKNVFLGIHVGDRVNLSNNGPEINVGFFYLFLSRGRGLAAKAELLLTTVVQETF